MILTAHIITGGSESSHRVFSTGGRARRFARRAVAVIGLQVCILQGHAAPFLPDDDSQVLEQLPMAANAELRELRKLHGELNATPDNLALALKVATKDIEAGRAASDPRYNGYAEAALAPWLSLRRAPNEVLLLRATLRQSTHDFTGALADLDVVLADKPRDVQARLTRATVLQVQARYAEAQKDCAALAQIADGLVTVTCVAGISSLRGQAEASAKTLRNALDRSGPATAPQVRVWALTVLAETEIRLGDGEAAERHFKEANSFGRDGYLLGAYADFLLDAGRPAEVRNLLQNEVRVDALLLRLALAEKQLRAPALDDRTADLRERFSTARRRGDAVHRREEAMFALHLEGRIPDALALAAANWQVQREPSDARILLEAALAAGAQASAQPVLDWMKSSGIEDAKLRALAAKFSRVAQ